MPVLSALGVVVEEAVTFGAGSPGWNRISKLHVHMALEHSYCTLQGSDEQPIKNLSCLVTVSDILECLCCILSTNIK